MFTHLGKNAYNAWASNQYYNLEWSLLEALGFSDKQIEEANDYVCGSMTIEGAPNLRDEHLPVFDCANKCGKKGERFIHAHGHIRMMGAVQPFISGAISKTINLPNEAVLEEIADSYMLSWQLGLKACALYRDGSKLSQPLSNKTEKKKKTEEETSTKNPEIGPDSNIVDMSKLTVDDLLEEVQKRVQSSPDTKLKRKLATIVERRTLSISIGLQYGVPLEEFVEKFVFTRFEPSGMVDHPNIKSTTSIVDFIFRVLAYEYLGRTDLVHVLDSPEVMNTGTDDWDEIPTPLEYDKKTPELSDVRIVAKPAGSTPNAQPKTQKAKVENSLDAVNAAAKSMQSDAPACNTCGHITIRSGTCYKCLNCGNSMGCS
jgi:ribonucleoside-diphosphate reductase alpha chain